MPISGAGVLKGAATIAASAGTAATLTVDAQTVQNGVHVIDASVTDYRVRPNGTFKVKFPTQNSAGVLSKDRKSCVYVIPILLASGEVSYNLIRIEREVHPETSAAAALELNTLGAQLLTDTDFASFWANGTTA